jgi:hypothetical protein
MNFKSAFKCENAWSGRAGARNQLRKERWACHFRRSLALALLLPRPPCFLSLLDNRYEGSLSSKCPGTLSSCNMYTVKSTNYLVPANSKHWCPARMKATIGFGILRCKICMCGVASLSCHTLMLSYLAAESRKATPCPPSRAPTAFCSSGIWKYGDFSDDFGAGWKIFFFAAR